MFGHYNLHLYLWDLRLSFPHLLLIEGASKNPDNHDYCERFVSKDSDKSFNLGV